MTNQPPPSSLDPLRGAVASSRTGVRPLGLALAICAGLLLLVWVRYQPPAPRPASAPAAKFSAARAEAFLAPLVGNGQPHPVGSAADGLIRQAIAGDLERLGYEPHVEAGFACSYDQTCAQVQNVVARLHGTKAGKVILVAAHYDSVPAGPGASDDGASVATMLEVARALRAGPAPRHSVVFLFDEGEEAGLLGAVAFVAESRWAREVGAAVNLEARGTSGPSLMFETGRHSLWLMPLFARAVPRPLANSLSYAIYRRLPNDTDFSIFRKHGFDGFNFAFIGSVSHYHTPLDNLQNLDPGSLQSQGDHALGIISALANAKLGLPTPGQAVFFDVAAWRMVWWPLGWTLWMAAIALALILICVMRLWMRGRLRGKYFLAALIIPPVAGVLAWVLSSGLMGILRKTDAVPGGWVAHPVPLIAACWLAGILPAWFFSHHRFRIEEIWSAAWVWWGALAAIVSVVLPEGSFVWLVPALSAGIFGLGMIASDSELALLLAAIAPACVAALFTFQTALPLYTAMGTASLPVVAVLLALLGLTLSPLVVHAGRKWRFAAAAILTFGVFVFALVAAVLPPYTPQSPERMSEYFIQNSNTGQAHWLVTPESGVLPAALDRVAKFERGAGTLFPWFPSSVPAFVADAPPVSEPGPSWTIEKSQLKDGRLEVQAHIASPRGAPLVALLFPPLVRVFSFSVNGVSVPPTPRRFARLLPSWRRFSVVTTPPEGVDVTFVQSVPQGAGTQSGGTAHERLVLLDESYDFPPTGNALLAARPAYAVRSQSGDVTIVEREVNAYAMPLAQSKAESLNHPATRGR